MASKKLEGVGYTAELRSISQRVLGLAVDPDGASESQDVSRVLSDDAKSMLEQTQARAVAAPPDKSSPPSSPSLPLSSVRAMRTIILQSNEDTANKESLLSELNAALSRTSLQFTKPQPEQPDRKYIKRMERLRLKAEERKYSRLVNNLDTTVADDQTMRSMQYATSVGMNMIVAPLSFGAFMYFFSGHLFGWVIDKTDAANRGHGSDVDIRAVIAGVVSGVCMLFIEMTLFVIRSHEMDAAVTKKAKKSSPNPFGYDKNKAARTFEG